MGADGDVVANVNLGWHAGWETSCCVDHGVITDRAEIHDTKTNIKNDCNYSTLLISPLTTVLYQTEAHLLTNTSPTIRELAFKYVLTKGGVRGNPSILASWVEIVKTQLHPVLGVLLLVSKLRLCLVCKINQSSIIDTYLPLT